MRSKNMLLTVVLSLIVSSTVVCKAEPVGTTWTYQGRLMDDNNPGEGVYDFQFKLFDGPYTGTQQGSTVDVNDLDVIDGYFTVELDFGSDVFDSDAYWLEIGVRPGGTAEPFTTLSPRQEITPTPYAMQTRGIFVDDVPYIVGYPDTWTPKESDRTWRSVAMSADGTKQTAVGNNLLIYVSTDSGNTWTPKESYRWWYSVAMSADGTKQTAVAYAEQIYVSTDSGNTWTPKESNRYWRSVAMSEDGTKQTAVGLQGQIYVSTDSGNTWTPKESNRDWYSVAMSADGTKQTAVGQNTQIYVSMDSGNTWTAKESNRNWWSVAMSADGAKQTAVVVGGQIYVSIDSGNTWTAKELNRNWYSVTMSADGIKQTAVVTGGQIYVSMDSGNTWTAKESNRQWYSVAMSANGTKQTAVVDQGQIYICSADMSYSYNVGIGTTNPQAKLDVRGSLSVEGKVGIGTTNPDTELHIAGSHFSTGLLLENLNATSAWSIWSDQGGVFYIGEGAESGYATRLYISPGGDTELVPHTGNVGIGTIPVNKLDVEGAMTIGANYSGTNTAPTNGMIIEGNVGIGTTNPASTLHVKGNTRIEASLGTSEIDFYHGATRGAFLQNTGTYPTDTFRVGTAGNNSLSFYTNNNAKMVIDSVGNVGIGTTNPAACIHVSDPAWANLKLTDQGDSHTAEIFTDGNLHIDGGGRNMWIDPLEGGNLLLNVNSPNGNVGIGTANPKSQLHIKGSDLGWPQSIITLECLTNTQFYRIGCKVESGLPSPTYFIIDRYVSELNPFTLFVIEEDGDTLLVPTQGKVGIGTIQPAYDLDVDGDIRAIGSVYYGGTEGNTDGAAYSKPDYVFEKGYDVMSIDQVETYLKKENHLPWMTSVKQEKEENGNVIDMTRMAFETVETVENIQIQVIELNKLIKQQAELIKTQQNRIAELEETFAQNEMLKQKLEILEGMMNGCKFALDKEMR
jgi:photosystem II stability/assembly factor-like uncharacterized protein